MLNQIRSAATPFPAEAIETTPEQMLLGCHQRIRHFSEMAVRLATMNDIPADEARRAAQGILRYFTVALPLHEQDENNSLHPRLKKAVSLPSTADEESVLRKFAGPAADAMVDQHLSIDELVERLIPLWTIVANAPERLADVAPEMREIATALKNIFDAHLKLEEESIIPAIAELLSADECESMLQEMKARRK